MKKPTSVYHLNFILSLLSILLLINAENLAQENLSTLNRDSVIAAAKDIIGMQNYCALITLDSVGMPDVRTMNPYPVEDDMIIWMATNRLSDKAKEIRNNPNVCVYFADHKNASGYVALNGKAEVIDDKDLLVKKKREYWEQVVPDWENVLVLIKIVPLKIEVVNYKYKLYGNPVTWKAPSIEFESE